MITFSPYDPKTRRLYPHINKAFLDKRVVTKLDIDRGFIEWEGTIYDIVNPQKLDIAFTVYATVRVTLSFQEHLDGNYVVIG